MKKNRHQMRIGVVIVLLLLASTACNLFQSSEPQVVEAEEEMTLAPEVISEPQAPEFVPELIFTLVPDFSEDDSWPMNSVAYSADANQLATGTFLQADIWNAADGTLAQSIEVTHTVDGLAFGVDGQSVFLSVNMRGTQAYDLTSGEMLMDFDDSGYDPTLALSQDGELIASGVRGRLVKLFRVSDGELQLEFDPSDFLNDFNEWVTALAFSPDGSIVAAGYWDGHIFVWDTSNGELAYRIPPETSYCSAWDLAFSSDGAYLAVGGARHELGEVIKLFRAADGSQAYILDEYSRVGAMSAPVAFSSDGNLFAAGANDGIFLWSLPEFEILHHLEIEAEDTSDWVTDLDFSPDGQRLIAGYWDGYALVWQVQELN